MWCTPSILLIPITISTNNFTLSRVIWTGKSIFLLVFSSCWKDVKDSKIVNEFSFWHSVLWKRFQPANICARLRRAKVNSTLKHSLISFPLQMSTENIGLIAKFARIYLWKFKYGTKVFTTLRTTPALCNIVFYKESRTKHCWRWYTSGGFQNR